VIHLISVKPLVPPVNYMALVGFDYCAIKLNNRNETSVNSKPTELKIKGAENKSARECFARAQLSTIDI
jgi:hypothetical protein